MNCNFAHFEAFATKSTPQEWIERGEDLMKRELYERAAACFKTAGDDKREKIASMDTFDGNYVVPASGQHIQYGRIYCNICVLQKSDSYKM
jgi:hypothetical protein